MLVAAGALSLPMSSQALSPSAAGLDLSEQNEKVEPVSGSTLKEKMAEIKKERLKNYRMTSEFKGDVRMPDKSLVKGAYGLCPGNLYTIPADKDGGIRAFARTDAACEELVRDTYVLNGFDCDSSKLPRGAPSFNKVGQDKYSIQVVETVPRAMEKTSWDKLSLNGRVAKVAQACGIGRDQNVNYSVDIGKGGKRVESFTDEEMFTTNGYLYRALGQKGSSDMINIRNLEQKLRTVPVVAPVLKKVEKTTPTVWTQGSRAGYTCENCK